jgi:hypothetical protein
MYVIPWIAQYLPTGKPRQRVAAAIRCAARAGGSEPAGWLGGGLVPANALYRRVIVEADRKRALVDCWRPLACRLPQLFQLADAEI